MNRNLGKSRTDSLLENRWEDDQGVKVQQCNLRILACFQDLLLGEFLECFLGQSQVLGDLPGGRDNRSWWVVGGIVATSTRRERSSL